MKNEKRNKSIILTIISVVIIAIIGFTCGSCSNTYHCPTYAGAKAVKPYYKR